MRYALSSLVLLSLGSLLRADYDPLRVEKSQPTKQDMTVHDIKRSREIPILVYLPKTTGPAPVVLFSHGLGGTRMGCVYLGNHWAQRGYVAVFVQHPGSDDSVWRNVPLLQRMAALRKAANLQNSLLRFADVPAVLDQLTRWNADKAHPLSGRLDLEHIGMSGHSFGAVTTQAVSGQSSRLGKGFTDSRIDAAIPMSPSSPRLGNAKQAFGKVSLPWMVLTGTKDTSPIGRVDLASRLAVFSALPPGDKYELVLDNAEHSAFTDRRLPGDKEKRNPNHHRAILAVTTAFWDAYLHNDEAAKKWLQSDSVRSVLEKGDKWQTK